MNKNTEPSGQPIIPVLAAVIFNERGEVLLARRKSHLSQGLKWEFPGGKLKVGESPEACLKREIREELGIEIEIKQIYQAVNFSYPGKNILLLAYLAGYCSGSFVLTDHQQVQWVAPDRLEKFDLSPADLPIAEKLLKDYGRNDR